MSGKKTDMTTKEKPVKATDGTRTSVRSTSKKTVDAKETVRKSSTAKSAGNAAEDKSAATKTASRSRAKKPTEDVKTPKKSGAEATKTDEVKSPKKAKNAAASEKDTAAKKPVKSRKTTAAKEQKSAEPSSKTPQVMKLVQQRNDMVNPTIMAGKSSIPSKLRGLEPLSRIMKREADAVFGGDEPETYNLTALVIEDNAADILRRFNACDCELCIETLSRLTSEVVPARFVKLKKQDVERNAPEVKKLKTPLKKTVTSRMVRLVMQNKKRSFHD